MLTTTLTCLVKVVIKLHGTPLANAGQEMAETVQKTTKFWCDVPLLLHLKL